MRNLYCVLLAFVSVASGAAYAQDLNPHVTVTNEYEGRVSDSPKEGIPMYVPDSLQVFDYSVDYSVFENPYRGSYEFHPYLVEMRPEPARRDGGKFYLNAGAGYLFHPELDMVVSPLKPGKFAFSVYDSFKGFSGRYHRQQLKGDMVRPEGPADFGHNFDNRLGIGVDLKLKKLSFGADVAYDYLNAEDPWVFHNRHGVDAALRVKSNDMDSSRVFYDFKLSFDGSKDYFNRTSELAVREYDTDFSALFGMRIGKHSRWAVDANVRYIDANGCFAGSWFGLDAAPQFLLDYKRAHVKLGVRLGVVGAGDHPNQGVYPDVSADFFIIPGSLDVYAEVGGGNKADSYFSLLKLNPYMPDDFCASCSGFLPDNSVERVRLKGGFRGNISPFFQYDLYAGYSSFSNALADALYVGKDGMIMQYFKRCNYNRFDAVLKASWKSERIEIDGEFRYTDVNVLRKEDNIVAPAAFHGELTGTYNINDRIFFGLDVKSQSERKGRSETWEEKVVVTNLPWYFDLGVHGEFRIDRRFSVWVKATNLLCQPVGVYLTKVERGPAVIAGICLNL